MPDPELDKISHAPSRDCQPTQHGRRGNPSVLDQGIRAARLEPRPFPEYGCIHREDVVGDRHSAEPSLQFLDLGGIRLNPADDRAMRMKPTQFRYGSSYQAGTRRYSNRGARRVRCFARGGVSVSVRGSGASSNSFSSGLARCSIRCHSSMATRTVQGALDVPPSSNGHCA